MSVKLGHLQLLVQPPLLRKTPTLGTDPPTQSRDGNKRVRVSTTSEKAQESRAGDTAGKAEKRGSGQKQEIVQKKGQKRETKRRGIRECGNIGQKREWKTRPRREGRTETTDATARFIERPTRACTRETIPASAHRARCWTCPQLCIDYKTPHPAPPERVVIRSKPAGENGKDACDDEDLELEDSDETTAGVNRSGYAAVHK